MTSVGVRTVPTCAIGDCAATAAAPASSSASPRYSRPKNQPMSLDPTKLTGSRNPRSTIAADEPVRARGQPRRQVAAVRAAHDADPLAVERGVVERRAEQGEHVVGVDGAEAPLDRPPVRARRTPTSRAGCRSTTAYPASASTWTSSKRPCVYCANGPPWIIRIVGCGPAPYRSGSGDHPAVHRVAVRRRSR